TIGDDHRKHRKVLMPAFSTINLRAMVPVFYEVAPRVFYFRTNLNIYLFNPRSKVDLYPIFCRTSLELIGRTEIGRSFDRRR
ncbi:hypothetical protein C8R44DRAFT_602319, partial [Mycena epipterygia]